ncbi:MAG: sulfotransferase domain-containing protein [Cyclobacteriaceae bacterium]
MSYHKGSNIRHFEGDLARYSMANDVDFVSYTAAEYDHALSIAKQTRGFHLIRDPRDVVVSGYFSHKHSHGTDNDWEELVPHRDKLLKLSFEQGLMEEIDFNEYTIRSMESWDYSNDNILELRYEQLVEDPYGVLVSAFDSIGVIDHSQIYTRSIKSSFSCFLSNVKRRLISRDHASTTIPIGDLLRILYENNYSRMAGGRKSGIENQKSHYRKGVSGDWKNYFNEDHKSYFKERYNEVLIKLGYESDDDW